MAGCGWPVGAAPWPCGGSSVNDSQPTIKYIQTLSHGQGTCVFEERQAGLPEKHWTFL